MAKLSIVIVAFRNMECLSKCLDSIPALPWIEVIVVNNSHQNRGFAAGCNLGAAQAKAPYLLFLNPDCEVDETALKKLVSNLEADESLGIVGPALTDNAGKAYLSCNGPLSKRAAWVVYSFLNTWFARSALVKNYWFNHRAPTETTEVGSVCGAALGMRATVFNQVRGFDEDYFLYWEEFDLARRVSGLGKRIVFEPSISIMHAGGLSTTLPRGQILTWFRESRFTFFKKHCGRFYAALLEGWLTFSEEWRFVVAVLFTVGFGWWFFYNGWWLTHSYLSVWIYYFNHGLSSFSAGYWWGVAGALFLVAMVYNELVLASRKTALLASLFVGVWAVCVPTMGPGLLLLGLVWMAVDLIKPLLPLRKWIVALATAAVVINTIWFAYFAVRLKTFSAHYASWQRVTQAIMQADATPRRIRCVGCTHPFELEPLLRLLADRGYRADPTSPWMYVLLPPFSTSTGNIPDTLVIEIDDISIAFPTDSL